MNLPSDLQRLLPYVAVAVLAVVGLFLVVRGVSGGGSASTEAQNIISTALGNTPRSGRAEAGYDITVEVATPKGQEKPKTSKITYVGRFNEPTSKDPFALGQNDFTVRMTGDARTANTHIVSAGEKGYMRVRGEWYELGKRQAQRVFNDSKTGRHESSLKDFEVEKWVQSPKLEGTAKVDGVDTDRVVGQLDVDAFLADLDDNSVGNDDTAFRNAQKSGEVELFVGRDDHILRKASIKSQVGMQGSGGAMRMSVLFHLAFRDVNKAQPIVAPKHARAPGAIDGLPASALVPFGAEVRGQQAKSKPSGGARPTSKRNAQAYVNCVQQATDTAALERCQALLPR
jgi:hypothetical protein